MLILHNGAAEYKQFVPQMSGSVLPPDIGWIDVCNGSDEVIAFVERVTGQHIPTIDELKEIENSSRLRSSQTAFYLSTSLVSKASTGMPETTPVGFILTKNILITVRFAQLTAFATFADDYADDETAYTGGVGVFVGLIDAIIDRAADVLEEVGSELDRVSLGVFSGDENTLSSRLPPGREAQNLRNILRQIGRNGDLSSKIRDSLLGLGRIVSYVAGRGTEWFSAELRAHLETQKQDINSLSDYDIHLTNKVQLLLDATMGLINIEQNNIIKVLTVVSVVGVPPTLVASMYGMNFHNMPEYSWAFGYPYVLILIALSAILPLLWFKVRGWV